MSTAEATVVRAVVRALSEHRGPHGEQAVTWNHSPAGETGIPDRFAVYRGRLLAIECKRARGGRLSAKQRWWLDRLAAAGAIALVVTDAGQVRAELRRIDEEEQMAELQINGFLRPERAA